MTDQIVGFSARPPRNPLEHPSFKPWRFELLEYRPATAILANGERRDLGNALTPTGRFGWVIGWLQDGEADVAMDDGGPPHLVKWRQCWRIDQ